MSAVLTEFQHSVLWHVMTGKLIVKDLAITPCSDLIPVDSWIKSLPRNWTQIRVQDALNLSKGQTPPQKISGDYPYYNGGVVPTGNCEDYNYNGDSVLISNGGASAGAITRVHGPIWVGGDCYVAQGDKYLLRALELLNQYREVYMEGSAMSHVKLPRLKAQWLPLPPKEERARILSFIEKFTHFIPDSAPAIKDLDEWYQSMLWHGLTGGAQ